MFSILINRGPSIRYLVRPWPFTIRGTALRLFATCWLVYMIHSATNVVREHYLTFAIAEHLTFRVDEYAGLHPDLFDKAGYGWHINANPGVSMMAALPYALARPLIAPIVARVQRTRQASGRQEPPSYTSPWPNSQAFFAEAWRRGLDVKFGLATLVIQALFMAPLSALAAVAMFLLLRDLFQSERTATWMALLFAFGTPVFFRTGYLNHNLIVGYCAALGFTALWDPGNRLRLSEDARAVAAGAAGGVAVLLDYTGVVMLVGLFAYGAARRRSGGLPRLVSAFAIGAAGPIGVLWFYQWASFGNPFFPPQQWMPGVAWVDAGYRGMSVPRVDLLVSNLFDYRYGLFTSCPLVLLALAQPWFDRTGMVPRREARFLIGICLAFWLFCGGVNYGHLQFNTGIRYMTAILPFLFILTAAVLARLNRGLVYGIATASVTLSWCLAMHRDVERGFGLLDPVLHIFLGGFELPLLTTVSRMKDSFGEILARGVSPLPVFALTAVVVYGIWRSPARSSTEPC